LNRSFRATVTGAFIRSVAFSIGSRTLVVRRTSPFQVVIGAGRGMQTVIARVKFADSTPAKILKMRYRPCAAATRTARPQSRLPRTPGGFTG
jgi:hypothetical protein